MPPVMRGTDGPNSRMDRSSQKRVPVLDGSTMDGEDHVMMDVQDSRNTVLGQNDDTIGVDIEDRLGEADDGCDHSHIYPNRDRRVLYSGVVYDDRMKLHANADWSPEKHHPEDPARIEAIFHAFKVAGLIFDDSDSQQAGKSIESLRSYLWRIPCLQASRQEIELVHTRSQYAWAESLRSKSTDELRELTRKMDQGRSSLYVGALTFEAACLSVGGAIQACRAVMEGSVKNAFAIIRPPGHHAEYDESLGFCIFNNVSVAAKVCQSDFPDTCRKVLILDWDVHHGNGVQNIFYSDPNVLYISMHVYQNGHFYPGQPDNKEIPDGGHRNVGRGAGLGKNVNIPWPDQGMGDGEYMAAFQQIVMPIAREFEPDLVIISAGFDAADGDELGGCFVTPACYAHMTHMLMSLANGRVAVCLEGGYNLHAISSSAVEVARTLMGEPPPAMKLPKLNKQAAMTLKSVQAVHAPYWECMRPGVVDVQDVMSEGARRLPDIIRDAQVTKLRSDFDMMAPFIMRSGLAKKSENQILVTPQFQEAKQLLVIIHDPPEFLGQPDPLDSKIEAHNSFLLDPVPNYIRWAIDNNFEVVDINVPLYEEKPNEFDAAASRQSIEQMQSNMREVILYMWDNYLELISPCPLFFMGIGDASYAIKLLLLERPASKHRITGIINFITGILRPIRSDADPDLSGWYRKHSLVVVDKMHACWTDPHLSKKVGKRRFGHTIQADASGISRIMNRHLTEVEAWVMDVIARDAHEKGERLNRQQKVNKHIMPMHRGPGGTTTSSLAPGGLGSLGPRNF